MDDEVELYAYQEVPEKPKRKFFLYQQVASLVLIGILLIGADFFTGQYKAVRVIETYKLPYMDDDGVLKFKNSVLTEVGVFRCEEDFFQDILHSGQGLEAKITDWLNIPVSVRQINNHVHWAYFTGIYWPFFFFPLLGLIAAILSLSVRVDNVSDLGFKFAILASLMLAISYAIIFLTTY